MDGRPLWASRWLPLTVALALLLMLLAAPAADGLSRRQANAAALKVLGPERNRIDSVVFGLRAPLAANTVVTEAGSRSRTSVSRSLGRKTWLFWHDQNYRAAFAHLSTMVLVDDRTGRVTRAESMLWYPLINGRKPPFLRSDRAYKGTRYRVFTNLRTAAKRRVVSPPAGLGTLRTPSLTAAQAPARPIEAEDMKDDCLVTIGDRGPDKNDNNQGDPRFERNYDAINQFAASVGLRRRAAGSSPAELDKAVGDVISKQPCNDVFIFLAGHGVPEPGEKERIDGVTSPKPFSRADGAGPAGVVVKNHVTRTRPRRGTPKVRQELTVITPGHLKELMDKFKGRANFKIKILSCYSGRFVNPLREQTNLRVLEVSSAADEPSWFHRESARVLDANKQVMEIANDVSNPRELADFVNGNVRGLTSWATNPAARDLGSGISQAYRDGAPFDFSQQIGHTTPILVDRQVAPPGEVFNGTLAWQAFSSNEVAGTLRFTGPSGSPRVTTAQAGGVDLLRVDMPPSGNTQRQITAFLCPPELPSGTIAGNRLTCQGGTLPLGRQTQLNVRTSPPPSPGMGGQFNGRFGGTLRGPFTATGP